MSTDDDFDNYSDQYLFKLEDQRDALLAENEALQHQLGAAEVIVEDMGRAMHAMAARLDLLEAICGTKREAAIEWLQNNHPEDQIKVPRITDDPDELPGEGDSNGLLYIPPEIVTERREWLGTAEWRGSGADYWSNPGEINAKLAQMASELFNGAQTAPNPLKTNEIRLKAEVRNAIPAHASEGAPDAGPGSPQEVPGDDPLDRRPD